MSLENINELFFGTQSIPLPVIMKIAYAFAAQLLLATQLPLA